LPVSLRHLQKKDRLLTTVLFTVSGVAFASFASFGAFAPAFVAVPIVVSMSGSEAAFGQTEPYATMVQLLRYSPVILAALAAGGLGVGLWARRLARQKTIVSLHEAQRTDPRPPVLF